jgi:hypothetical protein
VGAKLVNMAREPSEQAAPMTEAPEGPAYPYSLAINLDAEQLKALGFDTLPSAGMQFKIEALGTVTRASTEDPDADGDVDYACACLQITDLALAPKKRMNAEDLYAKGDTDSDGS